MSRRMLMMGVALFATQVATGCCTQRGAYWFPRLSAVGCGVACAPPVVPFSPVIRGPLLPRPLLYGAPIASTPAYGDPSCSSCSSSPGAVSMAPRPMNNMPIYTMGGTGYGTMGGPGYGAAVPHDSVLLPQPTMIPPGTPKVEATTEPKPMPK